MSIWTITSMNLPSASTAADPDHVATCSIASCSRQCRLIRSPTEISRAGKRTQTTTYSGYESEMDSHLRLITMTYYFGCGSLLRLRYFQGVSKLAHSEGAIGNVWP